MIESDIRRLLDKQINLDIMASLSKGKPYREIVKKTEKRASYVRSVVRSLKDYGLIQFGRWNVDIQALGMIKTLEFRGFTEDSWNKIFDNNLFLSYLSKIKIGKTKYLAMYTFPKEIREKKGSEISSWYYNYPHFEVPFFKQNFTKKNFLEQFEKENNESCLPHRGKKIKKPDIIDYLICRYVQLEKDDPNMQKCAEEINEIIGTDIDVSSDLVEKRFERLKRNNIIYPVVPLDFSGISYGRIYCIISSREIFKLMKTLNRFNMITAISFVEGNSYVLLIQCPYEFQNTVTRIIDQLDRENEMYVVTRVHVNRGFPYKYYLEKFKKFQRDKMGR